MGKEILYFSTDKLYKMKKRKNKKGKNKKRKPQDMIALCILVTIVLALASIFLFEKTFAIGSQVSYAKYNEIGNVDYKVYLKDNNFYESSFLGSGMQYVANLIKTINVKFNYELHMTEDLNLDNEYRIVSELQITERNDPSRVLYSKKDNIVPTQKINKKDDNLVINQEVDIDYAKYNNIVNTYKKNLGLIVSSNLILTFETKTNATDKNDKLTKNNHLQIVIPLSESTLKINMSADKINNSDFINSTGKLIGIKNKLLLFPTIVAIILTIGMIAWDVYIYWKHLEKDPYQIKLNSILKNYDRLIVTGNVNLDESKYPNVICVNTFNELVDAAENLGVPIMHYEVIKGEKSIFIVSKEDTLVKYRVTKAYLNNKKNKEEKIGKN